MTQTSPDLQTVVEQAKAEFLQARQRLLDALEHTPDDRLTWSPSATARTPLQIAAHCADSARAMLGNMEGRTFAASTTGEADRGFREWEGQFSTRDQVTEALEASTAEYFAWLDRLTPEWHETAVPLPFGLGSIPVSAAIPFMALHINMHVAQIHYIQTIYGDRDWHH